MHLRRPFALAAAAVLLSTPALVSCGFDYGTDQINTPAAGVNDRSGVVDVVAAVIVANESNSGSFIASLSNSSTTETITVTGVSGFEEGDLRTTEFEPIEIAPRGFVNLADEGGIPVIGEFEAGDFISVEVSFDNGEQADFELPIVRACREYEGLDTSSESTIPPDAENTPPPNSAETEGAEGAEGEGLYSCEYPEGLDVH